MRSNRFTTDVADIFDDALDRADGPVYVVNPRGRMISRLLDRLREVDASVLVRLLADDGPLKDVLDDFLIASHAADLIAAERLSIRVLEDTTNDSLLVSDRAVRALVAGDERTAALSTDDDAFVADIQSKCADAWDEAAAFSLRTPPLSRVRETLTEEIGPDSAADFDAMLDHLDEVTGNGDSLDEVTVSILAAANNGVLLYDIGKWGEDVGMASKATFSRTKTQLEDLGIIKTEKVPIDVGRPRLRLTFGEDRYREADPASLVDLARADLHE